MLFTQNMSDFEKLQFTEDYIKILKKALKSKEDNEVKYRQNLHEIKELFKEASPKFGKLLTYKREMKVYKDKSRKAEILTEKLERKNFALRQKVRELKETLKT